VLRKILIPYYREYFIFCRNIFIFAWKKNKIISNCIGDAKNVASPVTDPDIDNHLTVARATAALTFE